LVQQTQQKAGELMDQARGQVASQLTAQKESVAGGLDQVAQALRQTSQHLGEQERSFVSPYATMAAEHVEGVSGYLHDRSLDQLVGEAENFARARPTLFLAGAFTLGLLAARFLKSSVPGGTSASEAQP
jgi:hypothetical protein